MVNTGRSRISILRILGLAAVFVLLFWPASAPAQTWSWSYETILATQARQPSIAIDSDGNLHLSYLDDDDGTINYAFRPAGGNKWYTMTLGKTSGNTDTMTKLVLDKMGNPHICYTPSILRYAYWDGQEWHDQQVSPNTGIIPFSCAVAIAADGTPHLTWYQYGNPDGSNYLHIKYAVLKDGVWLAKTIDFAAQTGKWHSLTLDDQGNPYITNDAFVIGELHYSHYRNGQWSTSIVDSRSQHNSGEDYDIGMGCSIVLTREGNPMISYYGDHNVYFARFDGSRWKTETIDNVNPTGSWLGYRTNLVLDSGGLPHIMYDDHGALKHAYWNGTQWKIQVVVPTGQQVHRYNSLAIGSDDTMYVAYRDPSEGSLKLAIGRSKPAATTISEQQKGAER